jgi:hypothetical protein
MASIKIGRSSEVEAKYKIHLNNLEKVNISNKEHIINNVMCKKPVAVAENAFPYYISDDIKHYCIWWNNCGKIKYNDPLFELYVSDLLENYFGFKMKALDNYIYFENITSNKSIPEIDHIHVFLRNLD